MQLPKIITIEKEIGIDLAESFSADYKNLQLYNPGLGRLVANAKSQMHPWLDSSWKILKRISSEGMGGNGKSVVEIEKDGVTKTAAAFIKATHILEPVTFMKGKYKSKKSAAAKKIKEPMNQAYIDALSSYLVGKMREHNYSPHFCEYYGSFSAEAEKYYYNMSDEYESFRNKRWFWVNKENGDFDFKVLQENNEEIPEDMKNFFEKPVDGELSSDESDNEGEKSGPKMKKIIGTEDSLTDSDVEEINDDKVSYADGSIHSASISFSSDEEEDDNEDDEDGGNELNIYAEFKKFPVMLICMEKNEDTLDNLMISEEFEEGWDKKWLAWMFQVVAAMIQIQKVFGMTHNDLHTNNILWVPTEDEFLYYRENSGQVWKVPTHGKIFRIIDFGRSIFTVGGKLFYSDDFLANNDAGDQYNFGPFYNNKKPKIEPNRSFDLSRLASGLYEDLFDDEKPNRLIGGRLLTKEEDLEVWESESKFHDMLWTWLTDDEGKNILFKPNGDERFPGFDLYQHIAAKVHGAVPADQLKWFEEFKMEGPIERAYPLFI